ncbi:MAG TPA: DUF4126 domain-containing protein [Thermoanaerobaculia bacterium]|jgi:hypothetical protein|nr:DUF4126 domain-containing protein [Thermoanaerobaculia bacterium]
MDLDTLLSICLGVGLAAACGFRVFVPLLVTSLAAQTGHLTLAGGFHWIGTKPALIAFAVATLLEVLAYYVPWIDNALDFAAGPMAVVAGIVITASVVTDVDPLMRWSLAVIAGGGAAAGVQGATTLARHVSSWTTLGLGNHLLATGEAVGSVGLSVLSLLAPLFAAAAVAGIGLLALTLIIKRPWQQRPAT